MRVLIAIVVLATVPGCSETETPESHLTQVKQRGVLRVLTRNSPTTYYIGPHGKMGLEHDLASRFADHLGVKLRLIVPDRFEDILPMVAGGQADLAAAGLTVTPTREQRVRFGPVYQTIVAQVVYRRGEGRPRRLRDLGRDHLAVVAGSSHAEKLREAASKGREVDWVEYSDLEAEDLLYRVSRGAVDYAVADSNEIALSQRLYPELRVAFDLSEPQPLAWAFPPGDPSLREEAERFFRKIRNNGKLEQLIDRYYGHVEDFDYVGTRRFLQHVEARLPRYIAVFKKAGARHGLDWRLLAAMGYQESHWDPRARSPTGVRGIMMLTLTTAHQLGVENRLDPGQSILGGARYFRQVKDSVPERITEPDRTWMALAAYNVGFGHLEDARKLTQARGGNPDRWVDVKQNLPLLSQRKWYKKTRHGYARGREPVHYVENIRSYYEHLVWALEREQSHIATPQAKLSAEPGH